MIETIISKHNDYHYETPKQQDKNKHAMLSPQLST